MDYIVHVSFPRSGHHALVRCLLDLLPHELSYCDYYRHCRQIPCSDPPTNYQKTHDFDLDLPVRADLKYIVQIRNPLEAIPSWYEYKFKDPYTRSGERGWKKLLDRWLLGDNRLHWEYFFRQKLGYWKSFAAKWADLVDRQNVLLLTYHQFVESPLESIQRVLEFADPKTGIDQRQIGSVLAEHRITKRRDLTAFHYFERERFARTERDQTQLLHRLGIEPVLIDADPVSGQL